MYLMALANLEDKRNPQENKTFTISFITKRPKSGNDGDDDSEDNWNMGEQEVVWERESLRPTKNAWNC